MQVCWHMFEFEVPLRLLSEVSSRPVEMCGSGETVTEENYI